MMLMCSLIFGWHLKYKNFFIGKAKRKDDSEMDHLFCTKITKSLSTMDKEI